MINSNSSTINRRRFLGTAAAGAVALAAPALISPAHAADEITIFTWETYHEDAWIAEWTKSTGVKVNVIRTGSIDEMYAQVRSGAVNADILYFDSGNIARFLQANLITSIDPAKVPNAANIAPGLSYEKRNAIGGKLYGLPYNWGTQPLMYDASVVKSGTDSWGCLWDPQFAGKVSLFDDAYVTFPMIALHAGVKDIFNLTDADFETCRKLLVALRPQVRTIARGFDDAVATFAAGDAVIGYCQNVSEVFNLQSKGQKFAYSFPKEGTPTWIDNALLTPRGDRPPVYQFISDNLTPKWQARFINFSLNNGILTDQEASAAGISSDVIHKTNIGDQNTPGFWDKLVIFQSPNEIDRRVQMWNDFKAGTL